MATLAIDFASTDGVAPPDFSKAKAAGCRLVIPRAIYGRSVGGKDPCYTDPCWEINKDRILQAGLKRGAYLFVCYPKAGVKTPSPEVQAQAFIDYVQLDKCSNNDFVPFFDVEEASTLEPDEMFNWTLRIANRLRDHYGCWPSMYTSNRVWQENLKGHKSGLLQNCPLWLAKPWPWPTRTPIHLDGAAGYSPTTIPQFGDATNWVLYQYQGDATKMPGFPGAVDASRPALVQKGMKGTIVKFVQKLVGVTVDGDFGPKTEFGVKNFQKSVNITEDGIVGLDTWTPLLWRNI